VETQFRFHLMLMLGPYPRALIDSNLSEDKPQLNWNPKPAITTKCLYVRARMLSHALRLSKSNSSYLFG
jgi:hypothetical protein